MNIRNAVLFLSLTGLLSCQTKAPVSADEMTELHVPEAQLMPAQEPVISGTQNPYSGQWIEKDGVRTCDGLLTRVESEDFCVAMVPEDWSAFEFEGDVYYIQRLAAELESEE